MKNNAATAPTWKPVIAVAVIQLQAFLILAVRTSARSWTCGLRPYQPGEGGDCNSFVAGCRRRGPASVGFGHRYSKRSNGANGGNRGRAAPTAASASRRSARERCAGAETMERAPACVSRAASSERAVFELRGPADSSLVSLARCSPLRARACGRPGAQISGTLTQVHARLPPIEPAAAVAHAGARRGGRALHDCRDRGVHLLGSPAACATSRRRSASGTARTPCSCCASRTRWRRWRC